MKNSDEVLKTLILTLGKYKRNKTKVSPEDLKGKYKVPFQKLKKQLWQETVDYVKTIILADIIVMKEDGAEIVEAISQVFMECSFIEQLEAAVFDEFDLEEIDRIATEQREKVVKIYEPYFKKHCCFYITEQCMAEDNPQKPQIYNDLVDKFLDEETQEWIKKENPEKAVALLFIKGKEKPDILAGENEHE